MISTPKKFIEGLDHGDQGRPRYYPYIEDYGDLLFYIQRNQNLNAVIYEINYQSGLINLNDPMKIHWLKYGENDLVVQQELNIIQKKLAYGYSHQVINHELLIFQFVSYEDMKFYIAKNTDGRFRVFFSWHGQNVELAYIYIYAEDMGVFPQVKFAEFFGTISSTKELFYKKLKLG
jgi:hypothetical protein